MKSPKRWVLLPVIAAALFAMAVPTISGASTLEAGKSRVPVGTVVTLHGSNVAFLSSSLGTWQCARMTLKLKVSKNDGTTVEGSGQPENPSAETCLNGTKPITFTSAELSNFSTSKPGVGTVNLSFTYQMGSVESTLSCVEKGVALPFTYARGSNVIHFDHARKLTGAPAACGEAQLSGAFELVVGASPIILN